MCLRNLNLKPVMDFLWLQVLWPHLFNMGLLFLVRVGNRELPMEPEQLPGWRPVELGGFGGGVLLWTSMGTGSPDPKVATLTPALTLSGVAHLPPTGGDWVGWGLCQPLVPQSPVVSSAMTVTDSQMEASSPAWPYLLLLRPTRTYAPRSGPVLCLHRPSPRGNEIHLQGSG